MPRPLDTTQNETVSRNECVEVIVPIRADENEMETYARTSTALVIAYS